MEFFRRKPKPLLPWPDPQSSLGLSLPKRRNWFVWLAKRPAKKAYIQVVRPKVNDIFQSIEPLQGATFVVKLYMIGYDKEGLTANPIVTICCPVRAVCIEAMAALQESHCLETPDLSGFGMGFARFTLETQSRGSGVHLQFLGDEAGLESTMGDDASQISIYGTPEPRIGRKLRYIHFTDTTHQIREVTGGPIIYLRGDLYQLTVAHAALPNMPAAPSKYDGAESNSYWFQSRWIDESENDEDGWGEDEAALILASRSSQGSCTRDGDARSDDQETSSPSNASGLSNIAIEPLLWPKDELYIPPKREYQDQQLQDPTEEGLYVFLGFRPGPVQDPLEREISLDYTLLKLRPSEMGDESNQTVSEEHGAPFDVCKVAVVDDLVDDVGVLVITSRGLISGKIHPDSSLVKLPGSQKFESAFWRSCRGRSGRATLALPSLTRQTET